MFLRQDLAAGVALAVVGAAAMIYAQRYNFGSLARIGPGFMPTLLGGALVVVGLLLAVVDIVRGASDRVNMEWRTAIVILSALMAFGLLLRPFGLVIASVSTIFIASLATRDSSWKFVLLLAAGVSLLASLIFVVGLGLRIPLFNLPPWLLSLFG